METAVQVEQREQRPKKRRKVVEVSEDVIMEDIHDDTQHLERPTEKLPQTRSPEATLPSFPLPALPDAPSKSVLALQGLDQALIDAEIVDPATLMTIPDGEGSGGTGLSEKIRKRLKDLGITELFAGMYLLQYCVLSMRHSPCSPDETSTFLASRIRPRTGSLPSIQPPSRCLRLSPDWEWQNPSLRFADH